MAEVKLFFCSTVAYLFLGPGPQLRSPNPIKSETETGCNSDGVSCYDDGDCCSNNCDINTYVCEPSAVAECGEGKIGQSCTYNYECCSNYCKDYVCSEPENVTYHKVATGTDCTRINTLEECEKAASQMGFTPPSYGDWATADPYGCWSRYDPDVDATEFTFNSNADSTAECGQMKTCICRGEVARLK